MTPMKLSARALGVLGAMIRNPLLTSAEKLSEAVLEGQAAILRAMKELEKHGLIERGKNRIEGRIIAYTRVSEKGRDYYLDTLPSLSFRGTVIEPEIQPSQLKKPYSLYTDKANMSFLLVKIPEQSSGEENMPYEFFGKTSSSDDQSSDRIKWEQQKKREWQESKQQPTRLPRQQVPAQAWSCSDVVDHFVELMEMNWNIAGFSIAKGRFVPALALKRKAFDTDGEIERRMIDLFFESVSHEAFSNGQHLWRSFLTRYADLCELARASIVDPEQEMAAQAAAEKSWDWVDE